MSAHATGNDAEAPLWFMATLARIKLDGRQTNGRFGMFELTLPHGAAPTRLHVRKNSTDRSARPD